MVVSFSLWRWWVPSDFSGILIGTCVAKFAATGYLLLRFCRLLESSFRELVAPWLVPLVVVTTTSALLGRWALITWPGVHDSWASAATALAVLSVGYLALFALGLRLTRYFGRDDLAWMKKNLPGPFKALFPRVMMNFFAGQRP
jgi:hypothetical protein